MTGAANESTKDRAVSATTSFFVLNACSPYAVGDVQTHAIRGAGMSGATSWTWVASAPVRHASGRSLELLPGEQVRDGEVCGDPIPHSWSPQCSPVDYRTGRRPDNAGESVRSIDLPTTTSADQAQPPHLRAAGKRTPKVLPNVGVGQRSERLAATSGARRHRHAYSIGAAAHDHTEGLRWLLAPGHLALLIQEVGHRRARLHRSGEGLAVVLGDQQPQAGLEEDEAVDSRLGTGLPQLEAAMEVR